MDSPASCRISVPGSTQGTSWSLSVFAYGALTLSGWLSHTIPLTLSFVTPYSWPYNPSTARCTGLGFSHFARHYFGNCFFSSGYLDVSVPQVPLVYLLIQYTILEVRSSGFPHSDIPGSALVHSSPRLFAVTHVLRRHLAPRHPP